MGVVSGKLDAVVRGRLRLAAQAIGIRCAGYASNLVNTPYPPASKPGEPPHKRTGNLQAGITNEQSESVESIDTKIVARRAEGNPKVPGWLEFGTKKMAARPFMRPAKNRARDNAINWARQSMQRGA